MSVELTDEQRDLLLQLVIEERKVLRHMIEEEDLDDEELTEAVDRKDQLRELIDIL